MKRKDKETLRAWTLVLQLGISMMVPVFVGFFIGKWLDGLFATSYLKIVFLALGFLAAIRNTYILLKDYVDRIKKQDQEKGVL
ncbi:MAG: AtpZ/AtpI family protein [Lachnospiraceae bacterium]|nr:AtpZ/AtpI family protein [Lachnospiraceae bacterium]